MAGRLKLLKKSKKMGNGTHKEKRKTARKTIKMTTNSKINSFKSHRIKKANKVIKKPNHHTNNISNSKRIPNSLEISKRKNQDDEREILLLERNLGIKRGKPTPSIFYSEGVGDIIDLCDSIIKDPIIDKNYNFPIDGNGNIESNKVNNINNLDDTTITTDDDYDDTQFYNKIQQLSHDILQSSDDNSNKNDDFEITSLSSEDYNKLKDQQNITPSDSCNSDDDQKDFSDDTSVCSDKNEFDHEISNINVDENIEYEDDTNNNSNISNTKNIYGDGSISNGDNALKKLEELEVSEQRKLALSRLERQFTSILNRVSESNYIPCLNQLENIFRSNSINDCCTKLSDGVLNFCIQPKLTPDSIFLAITMIIQALSYKIGPEIIATLLQKLCQTFEKNFIEANGDDMKYLQNCIILFTLLYRFDIIQIQLIDDIITKLVERCLEQDIEMILICFKYCGLHLRRENLAQLKKWITNLNNTVERNKEWLVTSRVTYMLETINILIGNKTKKECFHEFDNELLHNFLCQSKSIIKSYKNSSTMLNNINFTYSQLLNADPTGRWWLVGSSFTSGTVKDTLRNKINQPNDINSKWDNKIIELAKKHRMNTTIKQNIFSHLMTSTGVQDAFIKIIKLNLNGKETGNIAQIVIYCCLQEKNFNMFYPKLIHEFSKHHRTFKTSFQFALWDKIRTINEDSPKVFLTNLNALLIQLLLNESITLKVFKIVTFEDISISQQNFFKDLFIELLGFSISSLKSIFGIFATSTKLIDLSNGIKYFLLRHVAASIEDLATSHTAHKLISDKIKLACNFMDGCQPSGIDF